MRPTSTAFVAGLFMLSAAGPALAETLFVKGITTANPLSKVEVPMVEVTDGNIDEAAVRALFAGDRTTAATLGGLDAALVRIPWITVRSLVDGSVTTYRGIEIRNVVDGLAASAAIRTTEVKGPPGVNAALGRTAVANLDIGALLAFYGIGPDATGTEAVTLYSNITFAGGVVDANGVKCEIGPASIAEFKARPIAGGQASLMAKFAQLQKEQQELGKAKPETASAAVAAYIEFLTSFEMSPMEFGGLTCDGAGDKGKALLIAAGKVAVGGWKNAVIPPITLTDFNVDVKDEGYVRFDSATLKRMDFTRTLAAIAALGGEPDERWFERNWQKVVPELEGFAISGLELDVPGDNNPDERVKLSLGSFDVTAGNYSDGIPASTTVTMDGLKLALPENGDNMAPFLRAAGFEEIDLGFGLQFDWDREAQTATLSNLSVNADELGSAVISASLANVSPEVFSPDRRTSLRASQRITVTELHLTLENAGILNLLIQRGAQDSGQNEAAFRTGIVGVVAGTTMALLGANPQTLGTVSAISDFINGRPGLELHLKSSDPRGIGVADFELMQRDPRLLAGRLQVTATASGDFPPAHPAVEAPAAAPPSGKLGNATTAQ